MAQIEQMIQDLALRTLLLIRRIKESEQQQKYQYLLIALERIIFALQKDPIDEESLRKSAYYIVRAFDGPLHNEIEREAYELAGEIGLLRRILEGKQGKAKS